MSTTRRNITWGSALLVLAAAVAYTYTAQGSTGVVDRVARGEHLVKTSGCHDCHTPWKNGPNGPEPDMSRMLSGHPETIPISTPPKLDGPWTWASDATNTTFAGPWGITYTMNLTPDRNTGLGIWTEDMFVNAIKQGRHMGTSRPIMPPMPWAVYRNMSEEDLKSIFAYLQSIPPIVNHIPDYLPPPATTTATTTEAR